MYERREMFKIQKFFVGVLVMNVCLSHLTAEIKKEVYPFGALSETGDITVLTLKNWPAGIINVTEKQLKLSKEIKELPSLQLTKNNLNPTLTISALGYIPGVPVVYIFRNIEKGFREEITLVPNRIFVKSSVDNAQIEATLTLESPVTYNLDLQGFAEKELVLKSVSYHEVLESKFPISEKALSAYMPGVIGKKGGISRLSFTRPTGEVLKLELPWGVEWLKYFLYYDENGKPKSIIEHPDFQKENPAMVEYFNSKR